MTIGRRRTEVNVPNPESEELASPRTPASGEKNDRPIRLVDALREPTSLGRGERSHLVALNSPEANAAAGARPKLPRANSCAHHLSRESVQL